MLKKKEINDYLYFGYLFPSKFPKWLNQSDTGERKRLTFTAGEAGTLFDRILDESLSLIKPEKYCIIPLSGGWDSRILLGAANERLEKSKIKTFSFGTPGQLDYELGYKVAKSLGVEHHAIDLNSIELTWNELEKATCEAPWTKSLDAFFNRYCIKKMAADGDIVLSGFLGDASTGSHLIHTQDTKDIIDFFVNRQNVANNPDLLETTYDPVLSIPRIPDKKNIHPADFLDFGFRQAHMIAPIVTPLTEMTRWGSDLGTYPHSDVGVVAPFAHPDWSSYWISVPIDYRKERNLFFSMFREKYPCLYKMPGKDYYGAKRSIGLNRNFRRNWFRVKNRLHMHFPRFFRQSNIMMNYLDFDEAFRSKDDYQEVLEKAIRYLKEKSLAEWVNMERIVEEHMLFKADYAKTFQVLIGLALNIKIDNKPPL